ncbi:unnamed protein product [Pedinophyceae sp. YPF-701]|nr:unnamed protein product [Pedinophyceae sp. YPF-701]
METKPGTCDKYSSTGRGVCERMAHGRDFEPEWHVREALASLLLQCQDPERHCRALDIGANIGYMSAFMASLSTEVVALEMQSDLANLLQETARMNCWQDRFTVLNGLVALDPAMDGQMQEVDSKWGWRPYGGHRPDSWHVPFILLDNIVDGKSWDLIKMDIDSFEGAILVRLEEMLSAGRIEVRSILVELNPMQAEDAAAADRALYRLQQVHGYDVYRLNMHLDQRFINQKGWDVYAHYQDVGVDQRIWEEMFSVRLMRYLQRARQLPDPADWSKVSGVTVPGTDLPPQLLLTKDNLLETTRLEHPSVKRYPPNAKPYEKYAQQNNVRLGPEACPPWAPCKDDVVLE